MSFPTQAEEAGYALPVTPSDTTEFNPLPLSLYVGVGGDLSVAGSGPDGATATFKNVPSGTSLKIRARKVLATGTTASSILALYSALAYRPRADTPSPTPTPTPVPTPTPTPVPTPTPTPATYLPTGLSASLALAIGTRKMVAGYNGPAVNAVRLSDSTPLDIGFSGQMLDRTAALGHQSTGALGLAKAYDQSGNGLDGYETAATNRMQLWLGSGDNDVCFMTGRRAGVNQSTASNPRRLRLPPMPGVNRANCTIFMMQRLTAQVRGGRFLELGDLTANQDLSLADKLTYQAFTGQWDNAGTLTEVAANDGSAKTIPGSGLSISVFRSNGSAAKIWRDSYSAVPTAGQALTSRAFTNGGQWGFVHGWNPLGAFAEHEALLIYNGALTDAEILQVQTALQTIYSSRALTQTFAVYMVGDSLIEGPNAFDNRTLARQTEALMSNAVAWRNAGQSGVTAATLSNTSVPTTAAFPAGNGARWQVPGATNVAFILCGTNDITAGASAATIYGYLNSMAGDALARGYSSVVICTLPPRTDWASGSFAANEATRIELNNLIRGHSGSNPYIVCDLAGSSVMGALTAPNDSTLYPDKLHPSDLGYSYLAPIAAAAIASAGLPLAA